MYSNTFKQVIKLAVTACAMSLPLQSGAQSDFELPLFFYAHDDSGTDTFPVDFDDKGNVLGYYGGFWAPYFAFIRDAAGTYTDFVDPLTGARGTNPVAMNNMGTVIGNSYTGKAWAFDLETRKAIQIHFKEATYTHVTDINEAGDIVGYLVFRDYDKEGYKLSGFIWRKGVFQVVDIPGERNTQLFSINDKGEVAGRSSATRKDSTGFTMDSHGEVTRITLTYSGDPVIPVSLGNNGDWLGQCHAPGGWARMCLYQASTGLLIDGGVPPGCDAHEAIATSMKKGAISGYCFSSGYSGTVKQGFIVRKSTITRKAK